MATHTEGVHGSGLKSILLLKRPSYDSKIRAGIICAASHIWDGEHSTLVWTRWQEGMSDYGSLRLDRFEIGIRRPLIDPTVSIIARTVTGTVPGLLSGVPVNDTS